MKSWVPHFALLSGTALGALLLASSPLHAADSGVLRVCADENYLPFSNKAGQGFENKVAEIVAKAMGRKLQYVWGNTRGRGGFSEFMARNLDTGKCDAVMNLPTTNAEEDYTDTYYTSSYVFVTKKTLNQDISSMGSRALKSLKVGFEAETPPADALKVMGFTPNQVKIFDIGEDESSSPKEVLESVHSGEIGAAITWQPAIGYFLKDYPDLKVAAVPPEQITPGVPAMQFAFPMSMGVRQKDNTTKTALNQAIKAHKAEINTVLAQYHVFAPPIPKSINFPGQ